MEAHTDTPVTTVPLICPICLKLIPASTPLDSILEFADYPGVIYHVECAERVGIQRVRDVLAQNWPPPPSPYEILDESPEDDAEELPGAANDSPAADENDDDVTA